MKTERLKGEGILASVGIARAAELLSSGGTVAFPTETVYGLGANALDPEAVAKIFAAKERPGWDPLIVHIANKAMLEQVAVLSDELRPQVDALAAAFWPGPLTVLLQRTAAVPDAVTAGRPLVGVRIPSHPVALELIRRAGVPVAAPSANRFSRPSPTTASHVLADLDGRIDAVLDGGQTTMGLESTVFDLGTRVIYRPGAVSAAMISGIIGGEVRTTQASEQIAVQPEALPSPGMGMRHYAPNARILRVADQRELLAEVAKNAPGEVGVMLPDGWDPGAAGVSFRWGPWQSPDVLARLLYFGFRLLDDRGVKVIVCPVPTAEGPLADALRERLEKSART